MSPSTLIVYREERSLGDKNEQDGKRWSDIEMWVDVGEKTMVTTLEASWPKALAILHFPLSKKQHENRPTK